MKNSGLIYAVLIVALVNFNGVNCDEQVTARDAEDQSSALECLFDKSVFGCLRRRIARDIDQIEVEIAGKSNGPPISAAIEESARFFVDLVDDYEEPQSLEEGAQDGSAGADESSRALKEEARKKKFGKKKKKHLQKLLGVAMLLKAKISLLLQLISTHFQLKFFVLAIVNLILNGAKFWLDLKKSHPAKVIYYEHAQHQHHYDHEDHDHSGYWGRSSNVAPDDLAYNAYKPKQ